MRFFIRGFDGEQLFKLHHREPLLTVPRVQAGKSHHQFPVQCAKLVAPSGAPVGVEVLTEQVATIQSERRFAIRYKIRRHSSIRARLKLLQVDPQTTRRAQLYLLAVSQYESGIHSRCQLRLERPSSHMDHLMKVCGAGFDIQVRPDGVNELLAMQLVFRVEGQELQ